MFESRKLRRECGFYVLCVDGGLPRVPARYAGSALRENDRPVGRVGGHEVSRPTLTQLLHYLGSKQFLTPVPIHTPRQNFRDDKNVFSSPALRVGVEDHKLW